MEQAPSEGGGDEEGLGGGRHHQERLGKGQQQIQSGLKKCRQEIVEISDGILWKYLANFLNL